MTEFPTSAQFRRAVQLNPVKFGYTGAYTRESLRVTAQPDLMYDRMMVRFTAQVLSGRTVGETQQATTRVPASWWQHLKLHLTERHAAWAARPESRWALFLLPLHLITTIPLYYLLPRWLARHPVRYRTLTLTVRFSQETLYPRAEISLPADTFGPPVLYESVEADPPFTLEPPERPRFANRHAIAHMAAVDSDPDTPMNWPEVLAVLRWLEAHGVNPDQLVSQDNLRREHGR